MSAERISPWVVTATGEAYQLGAGARPSLSTTRDIVLACNPTEALAAADANAFKIGIKNATADEPAEIMIAGTIGNPYEGCDARSIQQFMRANRGRPVIAYINSGGGLAFDGIAMHNAFVDHDAPVTAIIESIAGSAATMPAVGAGTTRIYENSTFFVHRAALLAFGNRDAMAEAIDWLDALDDAIATTYKRKTNKAMDKIRAIMAGPGKSDGTRFSAKEAVAEKFCNELIPLKSSAARNDMPLAQAESPRFIEAARAMRLRTQAEMFGT
jgi:ATP-dependent protease ClpP protease subunit